MLPGCEINSGNPAGFEFTGRGPSSVIADTLAVTGADTSWSVALPLDISSRLFVGEYEGYEAVSLINFTGIPEGVEIVEARLTIYGISISTSGDSTDVITLYIHPVISEWDSSLTGEGMAGLQIGGSLSERSVIYDAATDTINFTIPVNLIQSWVDDPDSAARGLAVTALSPAPFLLHFYSSNVTGSLAQRQPRMSITHVPTGGGDSSTKTLTPDADISLITYSEFPPAGELWVGRGAPFRTLLTFDVSHIPPESMINRAVLNLHMLPDQTLGAPVSVAAALPLLDEPWLLPTGAVVEEGTVSFAHSVALSDSSASLLITSAVAAHIGRDIPQLRLLVLASGERTGVGLVRFLDSTSGDENRPNLEITYSLPPGITP